MLGELPDEARGDPAAVPATVERKVLPSVGVALLGTGRKVRRVREDPVEPSETPGQVGPDERQVDPFRPGRSAEPPKRVGVQVGRHDAGAPARGRERDQPRPSAYLEDERPRSDLGERLQEIGVLPGRVDRLPAFAGPRPFRGYPSEGHLGTTSSFCSHAYYET